MNEHQFFATIVLVPMIIIGGITFLITNSIGMAVVIPILIFFCVGILAVAS